MQCLLRKWSKITPNDPFILRGAESISYQEMDANVCCFSEGLSQQGFQSGEVIPLYLSDKVLLITAILACIRMNCIAFPINTKWPTAYLATLMSQYGFERVVDQDLSVPTEVSLSTTITSNLSTLIPTTGTTGEPKLVAHSYLNHLKSAEVVNNYLKFYKGDIWLHNLPLFHVSGLSILFRTLVSGASIYVSTKNSNEQYFFRGLTHVSMVSTQFYRFLEANCSKTSFKAILLGGSAFSSDTLEKGLNFKLPLYFSYGMTETASMVTCKKLTDIENIHSGTPLSHAQIKTDSSGQILVKGDSLFKGYWSKRGLLKELTKSTFFETGDYGEIIDDSLVIHGRKDRRFVSRGENIDPSEIELLLNQFSGVVSSFVYPQKSLEHGALIGVNLKVSKGSDLSKDFLIEYLLMFIPKYKLPVHYEFIEV